MCQSIGQIFNLQWGNDGGINNTKSMLNLINGLFATRFISSIRVVWYIVLVIVAA